MCDLGRGTRRSRGDIVRLMKSVRLTEPGSIALATLLLLMPAGVVGATVEQDGQPPAASSSAAETKPAPGPGPRGRPFVSVLGAIPLITYAGSSGPRDSEVLTPADRFATSQLIGVGYVVNPRFRFGVMGVFNEVLSGLPPTASAWQFGGVAPVAVATFPHAIIGGGPLLGYRSLGQYQSDAGAVVIFGASIPLRKGLALHVVAPTTALFRRRTTVAVGVALGVAKVF